MRDVARGDLRPKPALQTRDEIGGLTRSFALMTQQLADARAEANRSMGQLDAARGNLQTILDNLTSGVIVLDARGAIVLSNPGATRILRAPMAVHEGDRKSTRLNSSHSQISYAVFCLKKKKKNKDVKLCTIVVAMPQTVTTVDLYTQRD